MVYVGNVSPLGTKCSVHYIEGAGVVINKCVTCHRETTCGWLGWLSDLVWILMDLAGPSLAFSRDKSSKGTLSSPSGQILQSTSLFIITLTLCGYHRQIVSCQLEVPAGGLVALTPFFLVAFMQKFEGDY